MREIKFRAWFKETKEMFNVDCLAIDKGWSSEGRGVSLKYQPHIEVMQYTGLKDKNGKDAYEKDTIKSTNGTIGHIEYSETHAAFIVHTYNDDPAGEWLYNYEFEIIGNLYENPELIKT